MKASKTLPKATTREEITNMTMDQATVYKNKYLSHEVKEDQIILTFFINPYQSFTRHQAAATKKIKELWKSGAFCFSNLSLIKIDHEENHLIKYIYRGA